MYESPTDLTGHAPPSRATGAPLTLRPRLVTDMLDETVSRFGQRPAIDFLGAVTTFRELSVLADRAAAGLQAIGVQPGDRVALCLPNLPAYPILYLGALRAGAVVVNLNPLYVERELEALLRDSGARVVATCDIPDIHARVVQVAQRLELEKIVTCPVADALPALKRIAYRLFRRASIARPLTGPRHMRLADLLAGGARAWPATITPDDPAVLQYTGGTTGVPKAAVLSHANLVANADALVQHIGNDRPGQDRIVGVLPLFHVFALTTVLNAALRTGAEMVLLPRFELKALLATLRRKPPTYLPAVPTIYGAIAAAARTQRIDLSGLRACISGGAPLPAETREAFARTAGGHVIEGYGLSEASPVIACNPIDGSGRPGAAGVAYPGTTIEIRDPENPTRIMPLGQLGEVCASGPQVMRGYWNRPDETRDVFVDGMLRTGDIGYLDDTGQLFIVDRIKDVILCGGYNVYPRMIEEAALEHDAVAEAIAIGVPDDYRGEAPKLFVTLRAGASATPDELCEFLRKLLSKIELPREIEIRTELPKTLIGKLSKKELVAEERAKRDSDLKAKSNINLTTMEEV